MKTILLSIFTFLMFALNFASAEVISSDKNGFEIKTSRIVNTNKEIAYQQFIKVDEWWNAEHTWFGKADGLSIIPKVGGCFCETDGDKQALHMTVSFVNPFNEIRMIGGLGPLQMLGIHGGMSWKFETIDKNQTKVIFHYQVAGYMKEGLDKLAPIVDKVQTLQLDNLANKLNQTHQ